MSSKANQLADRLYDMNQEIAAANAKVEDLKKDRDAVENELMALMDNVGTDIVRSERTTVSISETLRASISDYAAFTAFVARRKAFELFERRVSATAYRELKETLKKPIPGTTEYTQRRLNVRKA